MQQPATEIAPWMWFIFGITIVALLAVDHLAHRGERARSRKVALVWSIVWIAAGLGFNFFVWAVAGAQAASEAHGRYKTDEDSPPSLLG
jgi:tellurite resistance protein TerC